VTRALPVPADPPELLGATVHYLPDDHDPLTELSADGLDAHEQRFGRRPDCRGGRGRALLESLAAAELTGRGGGHFRVAAKWRRVLEAALRGGTPVAVANGAEGEPLSRKDATLLLLRPHLVLDGLVCAAQAVGAGDAVLWLHEDAHTVRCAVMRALTERSGRDEPAIRVALGPAHYLTGESSAVVNGLSGRAVLPSLARVPAAEAGVDGRPTLVHNVDTLARVALVARGLAADTVLVTVTGGRHLVVAEVPPEATLAGVVARTAGGAAAPHALLVGGYGGRFVAWADAHRLQIDPAALRLSGRSLGAGVIVALHGCPLDYTAEVVEYLAASGARQCGPCAFGLPAIADIVRDLADAAARRRDTRRLERRLDEVSGRGACHHPDGAVSLVRSALVTFADDVAAHLRHRCVYEPGRRG
jgi:NADH:ubiquinone oxidoreductase subunit F (NADH-binding)